MQAQGRDASSEDLPWLTKKEQQLVSTERAAAAKREARPGVVLRVIYPNATPYLCSSRHFILCNSR